MKKYETEKILEMYQATYNLLDHAHMSHDVAYSLSRVQDALAKAYYTQTGVKVGQALGWDISV